MAFPDSPRVIYRKNPLAEVFALLRFPPILKIDSEAPAVFQDAIRAEYPLYADAAAQTQLPANVPPQIAALMTGLGVGRAGGAKHQFLSQDKRWQATLTREGLELKATEYSRWEDFRERLVRIRLAFEQTYRPGPYARIALRYVDVIQQSKLGLKNVPWAELIKPYISGQLSVPQLADGITSASSEIHSNLNGTQHGLTLKTGIVQAPTKEQCFLIDANFHTHQPTEANNVIQILDGFNRTAGQFFRWCIEQRLHDALEPQPVDEARNVG